MLLTKVGKSTFFQLGTTQTHQTAIARQTVVYIVKNVIVLFVVILEPNQRPPFQIATVVRLVLMNIDVTRLLIVIVQEV